MKIHNQIRRLLFLLVIFVFLFAAQAPNSYGQTKRSNKSKTVKPKKTIQNSDETENWFTFTGVDEDFSLKTPVKFKLVNMKQSNVTTIRQYGGDNDKVTLSIILQEMDLPANNPYMNEFAPDYERLTSKMLRDGGFKVVSFRRISPNTVDWEQWNPSKQNGYYHHTLARSFIRKGRLYSLSCSSNGQNQEVDRKLCRAFLNSFKFLD